MKMALALLLCLGLCGCVTFNPVNLDYGSFTNMKYPPKTEQQEVVLLTSAPNRPYKELGIMKIEAKSRTSLAEINQEMLNKAREVGADAVINVQYNDETFTSFVGGQMMRESTKRAQGIAIVFTDK
jgi:hypothetical protein